MGRGERRCWQAAASERGGQEGAARRWAARSAGEEKRPAMRKRGPRAGKGGGSGEAASERGKGEACRVRAHASGAGEGSGERREWRIARCFAPGGWRRVRESREAALRCTPCVSVSLVGQVAC